MTSYGGKKAYKKATAKRKGPTVAIKNLSLAPLANWQQFPTFKMMAPPFGVVLHW